MSNTATLEAAASLIEETQRGPCLVGRGITVYAIMDYLKDGMSHDSIQSDLRLSEAELQAVLAYLSAHAEEVERDYAAMELYTAALRAHYEPLFQARSPYPPDLPWEEKDARLRQEFARRQANPPAPNEHHAAA